MKSGIHTKLFIAFFTIIVVSVMITGLALAHFLKESLMTRISQELFRQASLGAIIVSKVSGPMVYDIADPLADHLAKAASARVTIVRADGTVIGDSALGLDELKRIDNHADREEIKGALANGSAVVTRYSTTLMHDMLYVAVAFERRDGRCVFRISRTLAEVTEAVSGLRSALVIAFVIGLFIAALMSFVASHFFSRRLKMLVHFAEQTVTGQRRELIDISSRDEIGGLAGTLSKMSGQLEAHVTAIAYERDQFEAVLDGMNEAVISIDDDGHVALINRAGAMLLGISGADTGKMLLETVRLPALHHIATEVKTTSDEVAEFELPGDPRRMILAKATRLKSGGVVIVLSDVSELRHLERVRRDFVSNVSHELRTPVSIIQANAETLVDGAIEDREAAMKFLASMIANTKRLSSLIADLLDISRIEEERYDLNIEPVSVTMALLRAATALETKASERELTITVESTEDLRVNADIRALDQILFNFVDNAVKYSGQGSRVVMRARKEAESVHIEVEDNGPGVAPVFRDRLFERFFRVDKGRSRAMGGTGLGLAIVKHLAYAMHGEVGMRPATPSGSIFWISLPASRS